MKFSLSSQPLIISYNKMTIVISSFMTIFLIGLAKADETPKMPEVSPAPIHSIHLPHLVYLDIASPNGNYSCSGSVIHGEWVLTAAHCVLGSIGITAYAGLSHRSSPDESKVQGRVAEKYMVYPYFVNNWKILGLNTVYDFCLIKLETSFYVDNITIKVVEMDDSRWGGNTGRNCTIAGFGKVMREMRGDEELYYSDIMAHQGVGACPCYRKGWLVASAVCFINRKGQKTIWPGDSGSPLVCDDRQVGVASHIYSSERCELLSTTKAPPARFGMEGSVNVYTYICPVLNWLRKHVGTIIPKKPRHC